MLGLLLLLACDDTETVCVSGEPCELGDGYYLAAEPADWDGETPLAVALEFHGHSGTPEKIYGRDTHRQGWSDSGVLWVLPAGNNQTWNMGGLVGRDDAAFANAVLDDVRQRWPVDEARLYLVGFSIGAGVAAEVACRGTEPWAGLYTISGGWFEPVPSDCSGPPIPLMHLHGTADTTWPLEGRSFGPLWAQGGMEDNLALWRSHNRCDLPVPTSHEAWDCEVQVCAGDTELRRCLHDGGHTRPSGWNTDEFAWLARYTR